MTITNEIFTDQDFFEYSSLNDFRKRLSELGNINFSGFDKKQIDETIFKYLTVIPSLIGKYAPEKF